MTEDARTRDMLKKIRSITENKQRETTLESLKSKVSLVLKEAKNPNDAIAITDDPKFGQKVLSSQIEQFRSAVDGGAQFTSPDDGDVASSPLIYLPGENNLVFSGMIPSLGNLSFQFKLRTNTGYGAWVFITEGMILTDRTIETINRLYQFYQNWQEEWNTENADLERMAKHINES